MTYKTAYKIEVATIGCLPENIQYCVGQEETKDFLNEFKDTHFKQISSMRDILKHGGIMFEHSITHVTVERFELPDAQFQEEWQNWMDYCE